MLKCKSCSAALDPGTVECPTCGAESLAGILTGLLGVVCRDCGAYSDAAARACAGCGKAFAAKGERPAKQAATGAAPGGAQPAAPPPPAPRTPKTSTYCARCGAEMGLGAFCPQCGSEVAPARTCARVVLDRGQAPAGTAFRLAQEEVQVGRTQGQVLFPEDPCLANLHATFILRGHGVVLRDEGAAGGVYVRLRGLSVPLRPGNLFAVGDRLLRFGGPPPPPAPAPPDGTRRLGAPRPERLPVLVEEWLEGGVGGRTYLRTGPSITIGRSGCSINLSEDPHLSPAHAEIVLDAAGTAKLRDLGSSTGTFVRIPPGGERELHDGDAVRIGREVLRVELP